MFPASTKAGGICLAAPDVCQVPSPSGPVPTPFPNIAMLANASKVSTKVLIENKEVVLETSEIASSQGDEAGSAGGVVSGTVADKVVFKVGSSKVIVEGKGVAHLLAPTAHNGSNANAPGGAQIAPSQAKVIIAP